MATRALDPCARRITFRMQTQDVRKYMIADAVRRARRAAERAGGEYVRTLTPPKRIKRWCVLRSPHVNKTSREHFWMHTHTRILQWDAGPDVDRAAPIVIARNLPTVATRVQDNMPALMALPVAWDLLYPPTAPDLQDAPGAAGAAAADTVTVAAGTADVTNADAAGADASATSESLADASDGVVDEDARPDTDATKRDVER